MKDELSYAPSPEAVEGEAGEPRAESADGVLSTLGPYVRRGAESGALAGIAGVAGLARSRRAMRRGARSTAVRHALGAAIWFAVAAVQRRSAGERSGSGGHGDAETPESAAVDAGAGGELVGGGEATGTVRNTDALLEDESDGDETDSGADGGGARE
ncbi:hypothetical protein [Halomicrobium urmianum]|uniref:hypothetical protein n=1 Tax=Halomicrobium urmianum TaxID=1586233 RepID=UPI001CD91820|nr:hypothetical protein [Halomicrobium urmianum]